MSLTQRISDALVRVGGEIKAVRTLAASKYTKPSGGIPLGDLSSEVQVKMGPLEPPGEPGTNILGGVKNPPVAFGANENLPGYVYGTVAVDDEGVMSSLMLQMMANAVTIFRTGVDFAYQTPADEDLIDAQGLNLKLKKMIKAGLRWEQEILVQAGTRSFGGGGTPLGIHVPFRTRLYGIRYRFETVTTGGPTTGHVYLNGSTNLGEEASLQMPANNLTQIRDGLDIVIPAGSTLDLYVVSAGSGTIGKGLYMSLWGEYDLDGVSL
ncbi:hypothetical protein HWD32_gp05 [Gordonia phage Secretariat]|uniref:Uncharacterized protein n=1 Tax=Gordonia phage Secretariat TaxID=2725616 RepID=A0A6M3SUG3_9CAUD|nr:hypothetical protein HWD32_gp05 [Gordonia phage Secretariat]QJD49583.1 hypothetical protein SEA_SECRETARIAT_5 [Gordonia phage Secretariat]